MATRPSNYGKLWSRDEAILAFDLYCRIPFQKTKATNPAVRTLANLLHRSPASVARKLGNFGSLDPELRRRKISGLGHTSEVDRDVWNEFHEDWDRLVEYASQLRSDLDEGWPEDDALVRPVGPSERLALRKQRLHQEFFRCAVLSSYASTCCITGISISECLVACHIIPWSNDNRYRTDPTNGLCLSATFDRLFDNGLVSISADLHVVVSRTLRRKDVAPPDLELILAYDGRPIRRPHRFLPSLHHLQWHRENVFRS